VVLDLAISLPLCHRYPALRQEPRLENGKDFFNLGNILDI
jgi:hypothetical protein